MHQLQYYEARYGPCVAKPRVFLVLMNCAQNLSLFPLCRSVDKTGEFYTVVTQILVATNAVASFLLAPRFDWWRSMFYSICRESFPRDHWNWTQHKPLAAPILSNRRARKGSTRSAWDHWAYRSGLLDSKQTSLLAQWSPHSF